MIAQSFVRMKICCCASLCLALVGCSRSTVVVDPESTATADDSSQRLARGKRDDAEGTSFSFPNDEGGALLAKSLAPRAPQRSRREPPAAPRRSAMAMKAPALPLPPSHARLPSLPAAAKPKPLRPRLTIDETLGSLPETLLLPSLPTLPDDGRVRVSSPDVHEAIALPILAQPVPDRASLDDPTLEASSAAAVAATIPARAAKAPFLKTTLPDPYDRRRTDVPAPEESQEFPLGTPRTPTR